MQTQTAGAGPRAIVEQIQREIRDSQNSAISVDFINALNLISEVVFSRSSGFVLEFLQNAEDSGLEIDALGGAPGVQSARYGGDAATYPQKFALIYDALTPARLSARARRAIEAAANDRQLACSDISLWEIAMLISRRRLDPAMDARQFLEDILVARQVHVLPITPEIAVLSQSDAFAHASET